MSRDSNASTAGVLRDLQPSSGINRASLSPTKRSTVAPGSSPSKANASPAKLARRQSFTVQRTEVLNVVEDSAKLWEDYFDRLGFVIREHQGRRTSLGRSSTGSESSSSRQARDQLAQERQVEMRAAEAQLVTLRTELEAELENLDPMIAVSPSLAYHAEEARTLMREIEQFGMDIARARMERKEGFGGDGASLEGSGPRLSGGGEGSVDEAADVPLKGTLTVEEAEAYCDAQIIEMQNVQEDTERINAAIEHAKTQLKLETKAVNKLGYERSREEAMAKEAQSGLSKSGRRDLEVEEACRSNKAQLQLLRGMIGLRSFETLSDRSFKVVYEPKASAGPDGQAVILHVRLNEPGGRLEWFDIALVAASDRDLTHARRVLHIPNGLALRLTQALDANDLPLLVSEIGAAIQNDVL